MKVRIIRATIAQKRQVTPGEVLDVSKDEALGLIGANKAVLIKEEIVETTAKPMDAVETSEKPSANAEEPAEAEPKPKRGKSKKASE